MNDKENHQGLKVIKGKNIPLDVKGRKRGLPTCLFDDFVDGKNQSKKLHSAHVNQPFSSSSDGLLINLSEHDNSSNPSTVMESASLQNIMKDLHGLDFTPNVKKNRPVPDLLPLPSASPRNIKPKKRRVPEMLSEAAISERAKHNPDDFFYYSGCSDSD